MTLAEEKKETGCTCGQTMAIVSIPKQSWTVPTELSLALKRGTLFADLYFPFFAGGDVHD